MLLMLCYVLFGQAWGMSVIGSLHDSDTYCPREVECPQGLLVRVADVCKLKSEI